MPYSTVFPLTSTGLAQHVCLKLVNRLKATVMNEIQSLSKNCLYSKLKSWLTSKRLSPFVRWYLLVFSVSFLLNPVPWLQATLKTKYITVCHIWQNTATWAWRHDCTGRISTSHFSLMIVHFHCLWLRRHFSHPGSRPAELSDQIASVFPLLHLPDYLHL